jgi:hypothetical protein
MRQIRADRPHSGREQTHGCVVDRRGVNTILDEPRPVWGVQRRPLVRRRPHPYRQDRVWWGMVRFVVAVGSDALALEARGRAAAVLTVPAMNDPYFEAADQDLPAMHLREVDLRQTGVIEDGVVVFVNRDRCPVGHRDAAI